MDHTWDTTLQGETVLGFEGDRRTLQIFAPDALSFVVTGYISLLSLHTGMNKRFRLGQAWWRRAEESAALLQERFDAQ